MTPLETLADAYETERFRWDLQRDRMSGLYQVIRENDLVEGEEPTYAVLAQISDMHAAENMAERMGRDAGARAALRALAGMELPTDIINAASIAGHTAHPVWPEEQDPDRVIPAEFKEILRKLAE